MAHEYQHQVPTFDHHSLDKYTTLQDPAWPSSMTAVTWAQMSMLPDTVPPKQFPGHQGTESLTLFSYLDMG